LASASIPPNTSQSADVTPVRLPLRQTVFAPNVATKGHKDGFDEIAACTPAPLIGKMNLHFSSCISVSVMTARTRTFLCVNPSVAPMVGGGNRAPRSSPHARSRSTAIGLARLVRIDVRKR
jgi:hypothetical protein